VATAGTALRRLDRYDWLIQGIETLRNSGIDAVRVEPMARLLGVTKGSFYWHFKDRGEFLDGLLEYWETEMTDKIASASRPPRAHRETGDQPVRCRRPSLGALRQACDRCRETSGREADSVLQATLSRHGLLG
jgi:AcrR family transcriptional regulator